MPLITYVDTNFHPYSRKIITQANAIIDAWMKQGYQLTLRQIYYRFIALDLFPEAWIDEEYNKRHHLPPRTKNTLKNYKRLGELMSHARLAGLVDWDAMEDRTRNLLGLQHWDTPKDGLQWLATQYRTQKWTGQKRRIEVWIEKDALLGIFERVCCEPEVDVNFFSCRGYNSQSEMWGAAQRILKYEEAGQQTLILQFSDHDPSGLDMTRDIRERLKTFQCHAVVRRKALNIEQVRKYKLPPNPAKENDVRFSNYARKFGKESWELDALEPSTLAALVRQAVLRVRNPRAWDAAKKLEAVDVERIKKFRIRKVRKAS